MMMFGDESFVFSSTISWREVALAAWAISFGLAIADTAVDGKTGLLSLWAIFFAAVAVTLTAQWRASVQRRERRRALSLVNHDSGRTATTAHL